jgi:hypothetical protein
MPIATVPGVPVPLCPFSTQSENTKHVVRNPAGGGMNTTMIMIRSRTFVPQGLHFRRTFFASSTDHTRLLAESEIHCLPLSDGKRQYVLAAGGMELDVVKKVPQLHLARIYLDGSKIYGAKVVNKTLGSMSHVCGRLLEVALNDGGNEAHATLHGLSDWVQKEKLIGRDEQEAKILDDISNGKLDNYDDKLWEPLALEFAKSGLAGEANLYADKNGTLIRILHHADTTEFANTSGGAIAIYQFP